MIALQHLPTGYKTDWYVSEEALHRVIISDASLYIVEILKDEKELIFHINPNLEMLLVPSCIKIQLCECIKIRQSDEIL
jgi:hypothetical protein